MLQTIIGSDANKSWLKRKIEELSNKISELSIVKKLMSSSSSPYNEDTLTLNSDGSNEYLSINNIKDAEYDKIDIAFDKSNGTPWINYAKNGDFYKNATLYTSLNPPPSDNTKMPISGGTMTGELKILSSTTNGNGQCYGYTGPIETGMLNLGNRFCLWTDAEGGNIKIISPDGVQFYEIDCFNRSLRIFTGECTDTTGSTYRTILVGDPEGRMTTSQITLPESFSFNDITKPGEYVWTGNLSYVDQRPSDISDQCFRLDVFQSLYYIIQRVIVPKNNTVDIYYRCFTSFWSSWFKLSGTSVSALIGTKPSAGGIKQIKQNQ